MDKEMEAFLIGLLTGVGCMAAIGSILAMLGVF